MKKLLLIVSLAYLTLGMQAQPPADTIPTYPSGATYTHSSGTSTITDNYSSSTQYYNVIQCTGGTLTMNGCTITKTGDATVSTLVNNGTINRNGYTLTVSGTTSGSGVINETTGIETIRHNQSLSGRTAYTVGGRLASAGTKGIVIQDGKKVVIK